MITFSGLLLNSTAALGSTSVTFVLLDADEIRVPLNGYFQVEHLLLYGDLEGPTRAFGEHYSSWKCRSIHSIPAFAYPIGDDPGKRPATAYIRNRFVFERLSAFIEDDVFTRSSYHYRWSVSSRERISLLPAFYSHEERINPAFDPATDQTVFSYFFKNSDFIGSLEMLDLTYSYLREDSYDELGSLGRLRKLALPMNGSDLGNPRFVVNPRVEELVLWNTVISSQVARRLAGFSSLKRLVLNGCTVSFGIRDQESEVMDACRAVFTRVEDLTIVNCDPSVGRLVSMCEPKGLRRGEFDFIPSGRWVKGLRNATVLVDKDFEAQFERARLLSAYCAAFGVDGSDASIKRGR